MVVRWLLDAPGASTVRATWTFADGADIMRVSVACRVKTKRKRKIRMARLVPFQEADREFDTVFWRRVGAERRFAAMWQMVQEVQAIRGERGRQSRLQRSVEHIERLPRPVPRGRRTRHRLYGDL